MKNTRSHLVSAEFEATAIVNADEIDEKTNDLKAYKKPDSKFNFTMLKGTESITRSYYEDYGTTLTTSVKNELLTGQIRPIHLIEIGFSTPVFLTDCGFDLTSSISGSSRTYTASPHLVGGSSFEEQTDISKTSLSLSLSGADQTFISTCLNENIVNDSVEIYRGLLDSNNSIIADPILLYSGNIDIWDNWNYNTIKCKVNYSFTLGRLWQKVR